MLKQSLPHLSRATNLISQAVGASRQAAITMKSPYRRVVREKVWRAIAELNKAQEELRP